MTKLIRIQGDTIGVKKSILDLSRLMKSEFKNTKLEMFNKDTRNFIKAEAKDGIKKINRELKETNETIKRYRNQLQGVVKDSAEQLRIQDKILKSTQKIVELEKIKKNLKDFNPPPSIPTSKKAALAALGGAGVLGAMAFKKLKAGYETYQDSVGNENLLRGRGVTDISPKDRGRLARANMNTDEFIQARHASMDVFGAGGSTQEAVLRRAELERTQGLQKGTMLNLGSQLRGVRGGQGAEKTLMTMQAALIASGIKDEIGPYLETSANMLTQIGDGFSFDAAIMSIFNKLVDTNKNIEHSSSLIMNADQGIRGSSGEANAFFQTAFNKANIGQGSVGGIQAAIRTGGLFGFDVDATGFGNTTSGKVLKSLGIDSKMSGGVSKASVDMLDQLFGSDKEINEKLSTPGQESQGVEARMSRLRFIKNSFGLKDEGMAMQVDELLKKMNDPNIENKAQIQKEIENLQSGETELGNLKLINQTLSGQTERLDRMAEILNRDLGEKIAPGVNFVREILQDIHGSINKLLAFLGITTSQEDIDAAVAGKDTLSAEDIAKMSPEQKAEMRQNMEIQQQQDLDNLAKLKNPTDKNRINVYKNVAEQKEIFERVLNRQETLDKAGLPLSGMSHNQKLLNMNIKDEAAYLNSSGGNLRDNPYQAEQTRLLQNLVEEMQVLNKSANKTAANTKNSKVVLPAGRPM